MNEKNNNQLGNEYDIPFEIKVNINDLLKETNSLYDISLSGSLIPKEYYLHEFKKYSDIYKFGNNILNKIDSTKYNLLYIPNKEWFSKFRVINYKYN